MACAQRSAPSRAAGTAGWLALALVCALAAAAPACSTGDGGVASAAAQAQPWLERFGKFDAWVRRASAGQSVTGDREALVETYFAPVRNDRRVLAAWVRRGGARPRDHALPEDLAPPADLRWTKLRTGALDGVEVATPPACPLELPKWWRGELEGRACVLLRRQVADLTVIVAFGQP